MLTSGLASAQNSRPSDTSVIEPCEKVADELKVRRLEVEGLKQQLGLRDERDKMRDEYEANLKEQIEFWKQSATARSEALNIGERVDLIRVQQIAEYKDEVTRLRLENERLRRSRTRWLLIGAIGGAILPKIP